tara:strand:+ start:76651 stop:78327 length:1677 start_codon:yes stop_codon:yes gene_type:complete
MNTIIFHIKNKLVALSCLVILLLVMSCEDALEEKVVDFYNADDFFNTEQQANTAISGIYGGLQDNIGLPQLFGVISTMSDELRSRMAGQTAYFQFSQHEFDPFHPYVDQIYKRLYNGVRDCNFVIGGLKQDVLEDKYDAYLAEARFFRAYYHFMLLKTYGPIVISNSLPTDPFAANGPRNNVFEVLDFIFEDLTFAAEHLPESNSIGRVDQWGAKAMKAKAHLWLASCVQNNVLYYETQPTTGDYTPQTHYALVRDLCQEIKAGSGYGLYQDFENLWLINNKEKESGTGVKEHMVSVNFNFTGNPEEGNAWGGLINTFRQGLNPTYWVTSKGDVVLMGAGFSAIHAEVDFWLKFEGANLANANNYSDGGDTRRYKGYRLEAKLDSPDASTLVVGQPNAGITQYDAIFMTVFGVSKYAGQGPENNTSGNALIPIMRYSDVLLMLAEASNELGDTGLAIENLNAVRQRAYEGDSGQFPNANLSVDTDLGLAILEERGKEFVGEINRWYDLVRTKTVISTLQNLNSITPPTGTLSDKNYFLPIPVNALVANPNIEQSEVWK